RRLARIYARVLEGETPTVEEIADGFDSSVTTVYEDVHRLTNVGLLSRITETQPHRYRANRLTMTVQTGDDTYEITATLLVALARSNTNENIGLYIDRHDVAGLATATDYARSYVRGRMNARIMARECEIPGLEAETVLQELRDVIVAVEPDAETDLGFEELNGVETHGDTSPRPSNSTGPERMAGPDSGTRTSRSPPGGET
ncbi:MAG: helix-turn-helix transcriptional regulator, partial [Euryarchaeota archaeon]|nr:helix-turn-helix transcriptional regulator [Euryarchaeota archaeon]